MSNGDDDISRGSSRRPASLPYARGGRLTDKILISFHHACDQEDYEVAGRLLRLIVMIQARTGTLPGMKERKSKAILIAAYERLWLLRFPGVQDKKGVCRLEV